MTDATNLIHVMPEVQPYEVYNLAAQAVDSSRLRAMGCKLTMSLEEGLKGVYASFLNEET